MSRNINSGGVVACNKITLIIYMKHMCTYKRRSVLLLRTCNNVILIKPIYLNNNSNVENISLVLHKSVCIFTSCMLQC